MLRTGHLLLPDGVKTLGQWASEGKDQVNNAVNSPPETADPFFI
jgi:hypothetical protein